MCDRQLDKVRMIQIESCHLTVDWFIMESNQQRRDLANEDNQRVSTKRVDFDSPYKIDQSIAKAFHPSQPAVLQSIGKLH